ncbi:unnamed protein product [Closterium sp. NIES-54]
MIHAVAPHFLWPFAVRHDAHQLNLWPRVSLPETSPTLHWMGKVGDALVFWVWGFCTFVQDTSADKLSARAIPCVFLAFVPDAPGWQFYHPTSQRVFPSQDVTFDESVPFYRLFPYRSVPLPPPPLFLAPVVDSGAARGTASGGAETGGAEPEGAETGGSAGASPRLSPQQLREWLIQRAHLRSGSTGAGGARAAGAGGAGVTAGAGGTGGPAATGPGGARTRGTGVAGTGGVGGAGVGDPTEPGAAGVGGSVTGSTGAGGARASGTGAGGAGVGGAGVGGTGAGGAGAGGTDAGGAGVGGTGAGGAGAVDPGGTVRPRPYFVPLLQQVLSVPSSPSLTTPLLYPPPDQPQLPLQLASPLPAPSPYTDLSDGLTERREPASRPVSPVRTARRIPRPILLLSPAHMLWHFVLPFPTVSRLLATVVTNPSFESAAASTIVAKLLDFAAACRLDYATALVAESASANLPSVGGECALGTDVLEDRREDFECLASAVPHFASMQLAPKGDSDAPDIPTPRSYAEAITGTYVDEVPPPGANIVDGMWIFRVKRPPGSPPAFKARYVARGFSQRQGVNYFQTFSPTPKMTTLRVLLHVPAQRDYELHSLDFNTAFLQGSLHEEIWLHRPPGFTRSFPAGTQRSLQRPVYGLRQAPL